MAHPITRRQFVKGAASAAALSLLGSCTRHVPGLTERAAATGVEPPKLLLEALKTDDLVLNADAARLLGDLGSPRAVGPLVDYVTHNRRYVKTSGLDALARIGDRGACPPVRRLVDEPNVANDAWWYGYASVQIGAILALMALGDDSRTDFLIETEEDNLCWALFTWFGPTAMRLPDRSDATRRLKARMTIENLKPDKSDPGQVIIVCDTLGLLATPEARRVLVGHLGHMSRYVRARAAGNLLAMSDRSQDVQGVERMAARDPAMFARIKAAQALVMKGYKRYAEPIAHAAVLADDPFDRAAALDSLGIIARRGDVPLVVEQLKADDAYVRLCAAEALDRMGTGAAISAVAAVKNDPDMRVRLQAAKCLAAHGRGESDE